MMVTSIRIAAASPKPNCCRPTIEPATKPMNAANMISPAAVTSRPVCGEPVRRRPSSLSSGRVPLLAHAARRGRPRSPSRARRASRRGTPGSSPRSGRTRISPSGSPSPELEDDDEQPVGRADREQVEDDRLQRQQQRAERAHEQQVGQQRARASDEPRERAVGQVEEVHAARRPAARVDVDAGREAARAGTMSSRSRSTKCERRRRCRTRACRATCTWR